MEKICGNIPTMAQSQADVGHTRLIVSEVKVHSRPVADRQGKLAAICGFGMAHATCI